MDYTIDNDNVIFKLVLSDYFGKGTRYNHKTNEHTRYWINSLADYEQDCFDNFESFRQYIQPESEHLDQARAYLSAKGYTELELDLFGDDIAQSVRIALSDAKDCSYQNAWLDRFRRLTQERIEKDLANALDGYEYKLIDSLDADDYCKERFEADHLRLVIASSEIDRWLKDNGYQDLSENYSNADYFAEYALDYDRKPIDIEHIDPYNQLGSTDDWLEYFETYQDVTGAIDNYRIDEASKTNNFERASSELKGQIDGITSYIDQYIDKEPQKTKIKRQIEALKSVIKNS